MKIKETLCRLCRGEKTTFGLIYYQDKLPICNLCISAIKELKDTHKKDYRNVSNKDVKQDGGVTE